MATFPTRKLTDQEIEESDDLVELKEALLIRNNSHHRNAEFELRIPKEFNLDLETSAGPINASDIIGSAKFLTRGGHIQVDDVKGKVDFTSYGGHIELGDVDGELTANTSGGHIGAEHVTGSVNAMTLGGNVELGHTNGKVKAKTNGGSIKIWKAESSVDAESPAGSIHVNFTKQPEGDSILNATAGSVRVGYVEGLSFDIDATSDLGKINGPFVEKKTSRLKHQLNGGQHKLAATSTTGSIRVPRCQRRRDRQRA